MLQEQVCQCIAKACMNRMTWISESRNQHTSLHKSLLVQQVCKLQCRAVNQQVTGSADTERAVMNVLRWQAGYCSRTMHRGVVDWVPENGAKEKNQRQICPCSWRACQQAAWNENGTGFGPYAGIQSDQSSTNAGASCGGLRNKDNLSPKGQKTARTREVASFCSQTTTTARVQEYWEELRVEDYLPAVKESNFYPIKLALNCLYGYT